MSHAPGAFHGMVFFANGRQYAPSELDSMPEEDAPRHLLVVGVGRSGTTACAGILQALGFFCDTEGNPVLESKRLRALRKRGRPEEFSEEIERWEASGQRWYWKDPKLRGDFRGWLNKTPDSLGYLVVFRDALNPALRNHHIMKVDFLDALHRAAHNNAALVGFVTALKHRKLVLISYEKLLLNPERTVRNLARFVRVEDEERIRAAIDVIAPEPEKYGEAAVRHMTAVQDG
jgi:hypothetical protein